MKGMGLVLGFVEVPDTVWLTSGTIAICVRVQIYTNIMSIHIYIYIHILKVWLTQGRCSEGRRIAAIST